MSACQTIIVSQKSCSFWLWYSLARSGIKMKTGKDVLIIQLKFKGSGNFPVERSLTLFCGHVEISDKLETSKKIWGRHFEIRGMYGKGDLKS